MQVHVILESTGATVQVQRADVVVLTARELEENPYRGEVVAAAAAVDSVKKRRQGQGQGLDSSLEAQDDGHAKRARMVASGETHTPNEERVHWLRAGIRVRIVSKHVSAGAHLQKGAVVDVYGPDQGLASVRLADGSLLENVKQRHLETVLPAVGMACLILTGAHAGQRARLVEKRKAEERVVVEMDGDGLEVLVSMNDVAAEIEPLELRAH
jgi:G patch domain/KOW motif-containing protein